ncbi:hypothetical protein CSKR_100255 [Clonorchis sinensis]|uniref:Uncharacterized protein n=1 Tax=Clonorchis sinensis TaxID=79923 RepID=A0A8T1MK27_CLOSI|nr:hypothetical protein CSKR_100255 [Clonorchis sinensis]
MHSSSESSTEQHSVDSVINLYELRSEKMIPTTTTGSNLPRNETKVTGTEVCKTTLVDEQQDSRMTVSLQKEVFNTPFTWNHDFAAVSKKVEQQTADKNLFCPSFESSKLFQRIYHGSVRQSTNSAEFPSIAECGAVQLPKYRPSPLSIQSPIPLELRKKLPLHLSDDTSQFTNLSSSVILYNPNTASCSGVHLTATPHTRVSPYSMFASKQLQVLTQPAAKNGADSGISNTSQDTHSLSDATQSNSGLRVGIEINKPFQTIELSANEPSMNCSYLNCQRPGPRGTKNACAKHRICSSSSTSSSTDGIALAYTNQVALDSKTETSDSETGDEALELEDMQYISGESRRNWKSRPVFQNATSTNPLRVHIIKVGAMLYFLLLTVSCYVVIKDEATPGTSLETNRYTGVIFTFLDSGSLLFMLGSLFRCVRLKFTSWNSLRQSKSPWIPAGRTIRPLSNPQSPFAWSDLFCGILQHNMQTCPKSASLSTIADDLEEDPKNYLHKRKHSNHRKEAFIHLIFIVVASITAVQVTTDWWIENPAIPDSRTVFSCNISAQTQRSGVSLLGANNNDTKTSSVHSTKANSWNLQNSGLQSVNYGCLLGLVTVQALFLSNPFEVISPTPLLFTFGYAHLMSTNILRFLKTSICHNCTLIISHSNQPRTPNLWTCLDTINKFRYVSSFFSATYHFIALCYLHFLWKEKFMKINWFTHQKEELQHTFTVRWRATGGRFDEIWTTDSRQSCKSESRRSKRGKFCLISQIHLEQVTLPWTVWLLGLLFIFTTTIVITALNVNISSKSTRTITSCSWIILLTFCATVMGQLVLYRLWTFNSSAALPVSHRRCLCLDNSFWIPLNSACFIGSVILHTTLVQNLLKMDNLGQITNVLQLLTSIIQLLDISGQLLVCFLTNLIQHRTKLMKFYQYFVTFVNISMLAMYVDQFLVGHPVFRDNYCQEQVIFSAYVLFRILMSVAL